MQDWPEMINSLSTQIDKLFPEYHLDISALFEKIMQGNITEAVKMIFQGWGNSLASEVGGLREIFILLLCVGIVAALLINFTDIFENRQIADMGFYFVYLFLIMILMKAFGTVAETAAGVMENIVLFMKLLMPAYFLAVGVAAGISTATMYYQLVLFLIYGIEVAINTFLMPLIQVYVFLALMNGLWAEEKLHMLLELIKRLIGYSLKVFFALVTGLSFIQSMITPVIDSLKASTVEKTLSMIPGIGDIGGGLAEMMLGSAVLIKNSIGVLAVVLLALLCFIPLLKIWLMAMVLKLGAALSGIISDRRITSCMDRVGEGSLLVLKTLLTACGLLFITIAIVTITTNRGF